ncbi:uncharacterized protein LOC144469994 [Augochlora pura]
MLGEITLARPLEELTQITHVGAPVVLTVVAEELRRSRDEPPAQATVVDVGFLLGEPGNTPPYFESDNYVATIDENLDPGTVINFGDQYTTRVKDEDIGKAGVFALKLENNNGTFEINPTVAERTADFIVIVRDNTLIDYELYKALTFKIVAQEVGPATNLSASVPVTIFLRDVNDNPPVFEQKMYEVTLSENVTVGSRVIQVHATDIDTGTYGDIRYTGITGEGSKGFVIDPNTGLITVDMGSSLDREIAARLELTIEARDTNGTGNTGIVPLIVNLLDVNDNPPIFDRSIYEFMLNTDLTNFTSPAFVKAEDADAEPPNNIVRYEITHGNYENKFYLNETSGELILRSPLTKIRRKKQSAYDAFAKKGGTKLTNNQKKSPGITLNDYSDVVESVPAERSRNKTLSTLGDEANATKARMKISRRKRDQTNALYTLTARAYDLGIPHLSSETEIRILSGTAMEARVMMFVVPGEQPNSTKTAETLSTITGGRVTILEIRPFIPQNNTGSTTLPGEGKKSIVVALVEQIEPGTPLVDVEKIREILAANGVGIINGTDAETTVNTPDTNTPVNGNTHGTNGQTTVVNNTVTNVHSEEVTVYKAENKLLLWLLIILGLLMLLAIAILITCCICPGCPFYMAPRKRRVHSSETLVVRSDGRPKRHLHRQPAGTAEVSWNGRKQAWSADPTRRNWQFNKRNVKNCSLPGDVAYISAPPNDVHLNHDAHRLGDAGSYDHSRKMRMDEHDRMYMEEMEGQKQRGYDMPEMDSLQRHEMERESDTQRQGYRQRSGPRYMEPPMGDASVREQHFYREGNAEVLRLVTRGELDDPTASHHHHRHHCPTTLIVDGKDIILQRFIEDQKVRPDMPMQDVEAARMMETHQRTKDMFQQQPEIILIPDRLELGGHRQHIEEIGPTIQRLVIDHGDYDSQKTGKGSQIGEPLRQEKQEGMSTEAMGSERVSMSKEQASKTQYSFTDLELARQKALLARILLKRDNRHLDGGLLDSASYLETQSLPGQVAIATQTDRTAATQTDRHVRSRSDNDESDEDSRHRKKLKSRKKYGDGDWKRTRTLWMKSPIDEKSSPCFDKHLSILQRKMREVKEDRKISLEPDVLREISDSLNGNGASYQPDEDKAKHRKSEQSGISYKILNDTENDSSSSMELRKKKQAFGAKSCEDLSDDQKMNGTESLSSPDVKVKRDKRAEKSPKKEMKSQSAKKSEGSIKPSFRILEKEFTMLTKKFSKLGEKKFQESTGSDSTSQEKPETKKESGQKAAKKPDAAKTSETAKTEQKVKQKKETAIAKTKQKLRYQQSNVMSTGSSEFDELFEKSKKQSKPRQEAAKKQAAAAQKAKRQTHGKQDTTKQVAEEDVEKRKETLKATKTTVRAPKLASLAKKDRVVEESSASDQMDAKKLNLTSVDKKSSFDSSGTEARATGKSVVEKVIQRFSDDFVDQTKVESTKQQTSHVEKEATKKEKHGEKVLSPEKKVLMKNGTVVARQSTEKWVRKEEDAAGKRVAEDTESLQTREAKRVSKIADASDAKLKETAIEDASKGMVQFSRYGVEAEKSTKKEEDATVDKMRRDSGILKDEEPTKACKSSSVHEATEKLKEAAIAAEVFDKGMTLWKEESIRKGTKEDHETEQRTMEDFATFEDDKSMSIPDLRETEKLKEAVIAVAFEEGMAPFVAVFPEKPSVGEPEKLTDVTRVTDVSSKDRVRKDERTSEVGESKGIIIPVVTDASQVRESKDESSGEMKPRSDENIVTKLDSDTADKRIVEVTGRVIEDVGKIDEVTEVPKVAEKVDVEKDVSRLLKLDKEGDERLDLRKDAEEKHDVEKTEEKKEIIEMPTVSKTELADAGKGVIETHFGLIDEMTVKSGVSHDAKELEKEEKPQHEEKHKIDSLGETGETERRDEAETAAEDFEIKDKEETVGKKEEEGKDEDSKIGLDDQLKVSEEEKVQEDKEKSGKTGDRQAESEKDTESDIKTIDAHLADKETVLPDKGDVPDRKESPIATKPHDTGSSEKETKPETGEMTKGDEKEPVVDRIDDHVTSKEETISPSKEKTISPSKEKTIPPSKEKTIPPSKEEEATPSETDKHKSTDEDHTFLEKAAASDGKEEAASEDIQIDKVSEKEQIVADEGKEKYLTAEEVVKKRGDVSDEHEMILSGEKPGVDDEEKGREMKAAADHSDEKDERMTDVSTVKYQELISEEKSDLPKDKTDEDSSPRTFDDTAASKQEDSLEPRPEEQAIKEESVTEAPIVVEETIKEESPQKETSQEETPREETAQKETPHEETPQEESKLKHQPSKPEGVFLEVAEAVHLLDHKQASMKFIDNETKSMAAETSADPSSEAMRKESTASGSIIDDHTEVPSTSTVDIDKPFHSDVLRSLQQTEQDQMKKDGTKKTDEFHEAKEAVDKIVSGSDGATSDPTDSRKSDEDTKEKAFTLISEVSADRDISDHEKDALDTKPQEFKLLEETLPGGLSEKIYKESTLKKDDQEESPSAASSESQATDHQTMSEEASKDKLLLASPKDSKKTSRPEEQTELDRFIDKQSFIVVDESIAAFLSEERRRQEAAAAEEPTDKQGKTNEEEDDLAEKKGRYVVDDYPEVSLPLFTEVTHQDDLDDSDSSSDVSRKTTLTTRPYQTPRHRSRESLNIESIQAMEITDPQSLDDEDDTLLTIELVRDEGLPMSRIEATRDEDTECDEDTPSPSAQVTKLDTRIDKEDTRGGCSMSASDGSSSSARKEKSPSPRIKDLPPVPKTVKPVSPKPERKAKGVEKRRLPVARKKKSSSEESSEEKALHLQEQMQQTRHRPRRKFESDQLKRGRPRKVEEEQRQKQPTVRPRERKGSVDKHATPSKEKHGPTTKAGEIDTSKAQPKYMAWYKKNREEMERRRAEMRASDDESQLPRWLRRSMRVQRSKEERRKEQAEAASSRGKRRVKPLINVESEQLKAIVRQGRKLRKAEGGKNEDPPVQIFATSPPAAAPADPKHHLVQHSEYKYEKLPAPFYLHPPPAPHPSPQLSPEHFEAGPTLEHQRVDEDFDSGIAIPLQGGARLRHQQLLEKKSVFDIAYSEAAPSQLRADSTTPPS